MSEAMRGFAYTYRPPTRPRLGERLLLTCLKLLAEFTVAALLIVLWVPPEALGLDGVPGLIEALTLVVIYAVIFGYLPLSVALAALWGFFPRAWRSSFPMVLLLLGVGLLTVGHVLFGSPIELAPLVLGMILAGFVVFLIHRKTAFGFA